MTKVSVVMASYNGERFIKRAINSVLSQKFQDWELIVVDDKSTDGTRQIIQNAARGDKRIKYIFLEQNSGGPALPRNIGVKAAQGKYVAFLDQDDAYFPLNLEEKVKILDSQESKLLVSGFSWVVDENKKIFDYAGYSPLNWLIRKDAIVMGGYLKAEQNGVDELGLLIRLIKKLHKRDFIAVINEPLTFYFRHRNQNSNVLMISPRVFIGRLESLIKEIGDDDNLKNDKAATYARLANFYCLDGQADTGRKFFKKSLALKRNLFSSVLYCVSFFNINIYKATDRFLRILQKNTIWRKNKIKARAKYGVNYLNAMKILHNYENS